MSDAATNVSDAVPSTDSTLLQVLLIEDNADHAALLERNVMHFKRCAAKTTWVVDLAEGKSHLAEHHFDLVLLDLNLPDADVSQVLDELPKLSAGAPVIVLTAQDDLDVAMQALGRGAQDYLVKAGITPDLLERSIRYAVQRKAGEWALKELNESLERRVTKRTATLNLLHDAASVANHGDDIEEALRAILQRIVSEPGWCFGQIYVPAAEDGALVSAGIEAGTVPAACERLRDGGSGVRLPADFCLPERAAGEGQGQCVRDLLDVHDPAVREAAASLKIRAVVAFPIKVEDSTAAVIELFSIDPIEDADTILATMADVATHLGRVVERRQADRTLRESEERFRLLVNAVEDYAIIMLDPNGHVVSWNPGARRITGYRPREIVGRHFSCFYIDEDIASGLPARHLAIAAQRGRVAIEAQRVRASGERFPAEIVITALRDERGELQGFAKVTHDATQRKRFEQEIAEATGAEQQRIGQDLHDGLGQELTGLIYQAEGLRRQLERVASPYAVTAGALVDNAREALGQVRMIAKGLIPVEVDAHGLRASLEELTENLQEWHGVSCRFVCHKPAPVNDNNTATQLYRIVQESLTNALRHAAPSQITVELRADDDGLNISVRDDGKGFDTTEPAEGSGMRIMRYRARLIDAHLQIESIPAVGTRIACRVERRSRAKLSGDNRSENKVVQPS